MIEAILIKIIKICVSVIFSVCAAFILSYTFFAQILQTGFSMSPAINDRSLTFSNRLYKNIFPLERYDIITFYIGNQTSIKRIYGLPGETVILNSGNLYINDMLVEDKNLKNSLSSNIDQIVKLGTDEYYVLGDNLDSSKDSRFQDVGNIKREDIIGKVWLTFK